MLHLVMGLKVPSDVDIRVMLTFLELYQTLLGFVFFKLYTDVGLTYPPPLDATKDENAAGIGAFTLREAAHIRDVAKIQKVIEVDGRKISGKDVRQAIRSIAAPKEAADQDGPPAAPESRAEDVEEDFVSQPSKSEVVDTSLRTLQSLSSLPQTAQTNLLSRFTFFLSRETSRPIFEFLIRCFGGRVGWAPSAGSGSPFDENDESITHMIIDRPQVQKSESLEERERRLRRKYVQPQWVVDCINAGKILLEDPYTQGKTLPPHMSPFEEYEGLPSDITKEMMSEDESEEEAIEADTGSADEKREEENAARAVAAAAVWEDPAAMRAAELAAEVAGLDYGAFEKEVHKSKKGTQKGDGAEAGEEDMNKMMMSNKQRKLYERVKYSEKKREAEVSKHKGKWQGANRAYAASEISGKAGKAGEGEETGGAEQGLGFKLIYTLFVGSANVPNHTRL